MPTVRTPRQLAALIVDHIAPLTKPEAAKAMKGFVALLAEQGLLVKWREIEREIHEVWRLRFGASTVTVVSAHELTQKMRDELEKAAPGADLVERVDERLMAGAVIRIDDRRIDGSMAGRLARLKQQLMQ
jgi:F0F1-type ATP synthase delta subunit